MVQYHNIKMINKLSCRWEDSVKMGLKKQGMRMWTAFKCSPCSPSSGC